MRSGCSSFVVVCNMFVARVLWPLPELAELWPLAQRGASVGDPCFVKAAAVRSGGPGESSALKSLKGLQSLHYLHPEFQL